MVPAAWIVTARAAGDEERRVEMPLIRRIDVAATSGTLEIPRIGSISFASIRCHP
jgi:hypothetical protein